MSTDRQTVENQIRALTEIAERRGWQIVERYNDAGISGAKGRDKRPGLDRMLKDVQRRRFDIVMAWAVDRLGRSLLDLLGTIQTLEACGVDLYLDQQAIDTTTPMGKLVFQVTGAFAKFERSMIQQRIHAGLRRAVDEGKANSWPPEGRQWHVEGRQAGRRRNRYCAARERDPFCAESIGEVLQPVGLPARQHASRAGCHGAARRLANRRRKK